MSDAQPIETTRYTVVHDYVSPTADVLTADQLRDYLAEMEFSLSLATLDVRDDGIYANVGDGLGIVRIAEIKS